MNPIPEERALSPPTGEYHGGAGSTGTWTRSGIRMGSGLLLQSPPSSVAPPPQQQPLHTWFTSSNLGPSSQKENNDDEQEEEASDWEQEVSERGELFYVVPYHSSNDDDLQQHEQRGFASSNKGHSRDVRDEERRRQKPGGKLSRLVRRRESKRDRNRVPQGTPKYNSRSNNSEDGKRNYESSDNDSSSTYGQIKTFETLFEASPSGHSLMSKNDAQKVTLTDSEDNVSSSSSGEMTEIHEVFVKFNAKQFKSQLQHFHMVMNADNPRNNGLLLEVLLGIVAEKRSPMSEEAAVLESSILIAGFIAQSPSAKVSPQLKVGDILRSMDGFHVTLDNVNSFLLQKLSSNSHSSSCKVKLIIQRAKHSKKLKTNISPIVPNSILVEPRVEKLDYLKILNGPPQDISDQLTRLPHFAIYVTRHNISETSPESADIIFQYPDQKGDMKNQLRHDILVQIRGIFMTLNQLLAEIFSLNLANGGGGFVRGDDSTMSISSVILGSGSGPADLVHIAYVGEGEDLFMIGMPGCKISAKSLSVAGEEIVRFLRLKFGTLSKAFSTEDVISVGEKEAELRKLFSLLFLEHLVDMNEVEKSGNIFLDLKTLYSQNGVQFENETSLTHWLRLPDEIKFQVDDALVQLESAYFQDLTDDFYDLPREFHILGACLFHKGLLVTSHLDRNQLADVYLWCKTTKLLKLTRNQPLQRLVTWQEIFPTNVSATEEHRHFLLMVGRDHQLLGVLLQTGGCTAQPSGVVRPDPFYVDQALNTLDHLQDMGIPLVCNKWLTLPSNPDLLNVDKLYDHSDKKKDKRGHQNSPSAGVVLCRTKHISHDSISGSVSGGEDSDSEPNKSCSDMSEELQTAFREEIEEGETRRDKLAKDGHGTKKTSFGSGRAHESEDDSSVWQLPRSGHRSHLNFTDIKAKGSTSGTSHTASVEGNSSDVDQLVAYKVSQLSMSQENMIFHYFHLDVGEGIFLAPLAPASSPLHSEVLAQFRISCHLIHSTFQMAINSRESLRQGTSNKTWVNRNLVAIKEQAMLFHWKPQVGPPSKQQSLPVLSYWVCGRLFGGSNGSAARECYVAHHESAPQLVVEMAFRLAYGVQL